MPITDMSRRSPAHVERVEHVKRFRALAIITATAAIVAIPGAAMAGGQDTCVAETVQMLKFSFRGAAQAERGAVADLIAVARSNPEAYPWCW
jgi:hypothetical protein